MSLVHSRIQCIMEYDSYTTILNHISTPLKRLNILPKDKTLVTDLILRNGSNAQGFACWPWSNKKPFKIIDLYGQTICLWARHISLTK